MDENNESSADAQRMHSIPGNVTAVQRQMATGPPALFVAVAVAVPIKLN